MNQTGITCFMHTYDQIISTKKKWELYNLFFFLNITPPLNIKKMQIAIHKNYNEDFVLFLRLYYIGVG